MGVSLDNKNLIGGYRPALFKNVLRGYARTLNPENLIDLKGVFPLRRDGAIIFEECLDRGLIDPETLQLTSADETLSRAEAQKRTPLEKAEAVLNTFLDNAEATNADQDAISQVDKVWLFGSMMRREATVGDIDLAVCTPRKSRFADPRARAQHARRLVDASADAPSYWRARGLAQEAEPLRCAASSAACRRSGRDERPCITRRPLPHHFRSKPRGQGR